MQFKEILIICTGNICRSPMAEVLFKERLSSEAEHPHISSAGTGALVGRGATAEVTSLMQERGIDVTHHRARQVDADILRNTDLVLAAETEHVRWVTARFPLMRGRVHLLGRWQGNIDIPDPYRQGMPAFERVLDTLDACVDDWLERLGFRQAKV